MPVHGRFEVGRKIWLLFQSISPSPTIHHKPPKNRHFPSRYSPSARQKGCIKVVQHSGRCEIAAPLLLSFPPATRLHHELHARRADRICTPAPRLQPVAQASGAVAPATAPEHITPCIARPPAGPPGTRPLPARPSPHTPCARPRPCRPPAPRAQSRAPRC